MKKILTITCAVAVLAMSQLGAQALSFSDALGWYTPPEPASAASEAGYINELLNATVTGLRTVDGVSYTSIAGDLTGYADVDAQDADKDETGTYTGIDVTGVNYLVGKYNGPNGAGFVWYVGDISGTVDIPSTVTGAGYTRPSDGSALKGGLSHTSAFDGEQSVPDAGATLALMGLALMGLEGVRRKVRR